MSEKNSLPRYQFFLVVMWEERNQDDDLNAWRFRLEAPAQKEQWGFTDIEALCLALQKHCAEVQKRSSYLPGNSKFPERFIHKRDK